MFPLLLLLTQVCSASQSSLTSSTFSLHTESTHTGTVQNDQMDGFYINVTSASVHTLTFDLQTLQGNPDLYVFAEVNKGEVAIVVESHNLTIRETDIELKGDGLGLIRRFGVLIGGASSEVSKYILTITALGASEWKVASEESLNSHIAALSKTSLFTAKKGDLSKQKSTKGSGAKSLAGELLFWIVFELLILLVKETIRGNIWPLVVVLATLAGSCCVWVCVVIVQEREKELARSKLT